jgi:hypothetical protein
MKRIKLTPEQIENQEKIRQLAKEISERSKELCQLICKDRKTGKTHPEATNAFIQFAIIQAVDEEGYLKDAGYDCQSVHGGHDNLRYAITRAILHDPELIEVFTDGMKGAVGKSVMEILEMFGQKPQPKGPDPKHN